MRASRLGIYLVFACAVHLWSGAIPQEAGNNAQRPTTQVGTAPTVDFDVKVAPSGNEFLVRRKGTEKWTESSKLSEPVAVGLLDGTSLVYVASKAIKPAKAKHMQEPTYPDREWKSGNGGRAILHVVVDGKGNVRIPTADSSPGPAFARAAIEAVKKWTFEPAKLNGEPVAVLITIEMEFWR
jgi:protein TonB